MEDNFLLQPTEPQANDLVEPFINNSKLQKSVSLKNSKLFGA